jgi:hypothetical protein
MIDVALERPRIGFSTALLAVVVSSVLRAPWFVLLLIMPATLAGVAIFCFVLMSAGVVLLYTCLKWFGWTMPARGAFAARALPAAVAIATTGAFGLSTSWPILLVLVGLEFALATWVVTAKARPILDVHGITGFEEGELLAWRDDDEETLTAEDRYDRDVASLVREARETRVRTSY